MTIWRKSYGHTRLDSFCASILLVYKSIWFSHSKRLHLRNYIIYLLLSDAVRNKHKQDFEQWFCQVDAKDASQLGHGAQNVIENMAERLARGNPSDASTSSTLGSHAMLWNFKKGAKIEA
jgi:hypothetical protein